jgi:WD40 repeat protein
MTAPQVLRPFPGLRPFRMDEAHIFFGREGQSDELVRKLARRRFLAVVGGSGGGKSSLVKAGLLPYLLAGYLGEAGAHWRFAEFRPGSDPLRNLSAALAAVGLVNVTPDHMQEDPMAIPRAVEGARNDGSFKPEENLLIVADQFEELFRYGVRSEGTTSDRDEKAIFVRLLLEAFRQKTVPIYVALTMRSEFLGDCARFRDLPEEINEAQFLTPRLTREQRRRAIEGPISVAGGAIGAKLVQNLLNEVGDDPDQLPVLQHALMRTWDHWLDKQEPHDPEQRNDEIGSDDYGRIGRLENALSWHAEEALKDVTQQSGGKGAELVKRVFLLLRERDFRGREVRRPQSIRQLMEATDAPLEEVVAVVRAFAGPGRTFLFASNPTLSPATDVDITHESLLRKWKALAEEWVPAELESARIYLRLAERAAEQTDGASAYLSGVALSEAVDWWQTRKPTGPWARRYHPGFTLAEKFLADSRRADQRRKWKRLGWPVAGAAVVALSFVAFLGWKAVDASKRAAEAAREAATASERATKAEKKLRETAEERERRGLGEKSEAEHQARLASSRELTAAAVQSLGIEPERGLFLALYAALVTSSADNTVIPETEDALHRALQGWRVGRTLARPERIPPDQRRPVWNLAFSRDGSRIATASGDGTATTWDVDSGRQIPPVFRHDGSVYGVSFSPDGKRLATSDERGNVRVWDIGADRPPRDFIGHAKPVRSVSFSPDGKQLATGSVDRTARIWAVDSRGELLKMEQREEVSRVVFSPDGATLAIASGSVVTIYETATGKSRKTLEGHEERVTAVSFSRNGRYLATASADLTARVWDTTSGRTLLVLAGHRRPEARSRQRQEFVADVAFSPDGQWVVTAGTDKTVKIWAFESGREVMTLPGHTDSVNSVAFSVDGRHLATATKDGTTKIWEVPASGEVLKLPDHPAAVFHAVFSPDGTRIVTTTARVVKIWDFASGREEFALPHDGIVLRSAFSPDGRRLATLSDVALTLWDLESRRPLFVAPNNLRSVLPGVAFSSDGKRVAAGGAQGAPRMWDADSGRELGGKLSGHKSDVNGVAFSPDGQRIATANADKTATIWDVRSGRAVSTLRGHTAAVYDITYDTDGTRLATASADGTARVWDAAGGSELLTLSGHAEDVIEVVFSPDGRRLTTASIDGTARMWNSTSGRELVVLQSLSGGAVYGVAYSSDGNYLATASQDKAARVYSLGTRDLILRARRQITRPLEREECRDYLGTQSKTCPPLVDALNLVATGNARARAGRLAEAISDFKKAMSLSSVLTFDPDAEAGIQSTKLLLGEGRYLARLGDVKAATESFRKARELNPSLRLDPKAQAEGLASSPHLEEARSLARGGNIEAAAASFRRAQQIDSTVRLDPVVEAKRFAAPRYREEGASLARKGEVEAAIQSLRKAKEFDPTLSIDPIVEAGRLAAPLYLEEGRSLARKGEVEAAIQSLRRAQELNPKLDLDPRAEVTRQVAQNKLDEGRRMALERKVDEAVAAYAEAQRLYPPLVISAVDWNSLCWYGSLSGGASRVMSACERAVALNPGSGAIRDSRGLARALTGNIQGAIDDFQTFISSIANLDKRQQRERWIEAMRAGQNPLALSAEEVEMLFRQ